MIPNNYNVLAWYDSPDKMNHNKTYIYEKYNLVAPDRRLLPFQIQREKRANQITSFVLQNDKTGEQYNILQTAIEQNLRIVKFDDKDYDIIQYTAHFPLSVEMKEGSYFAVLSDGVETWYSELFINTINTSNHLKIEWWDLSNMETPDGEIDYTNQYRNFVLLPTELGKPEYPFEEEVDKRDGYTFVEKQVSEKTYKFTFVAPEFLLDAMRLIRMHDCITITNKGVSYSADTFLITPKWLDHGDLASVEAEFQCATVVKKVGRGIVSTTADFSESFNNDFKK